MATLLAIDNIAARAGRALQPKTEETMERGGVSLAIPADRQIEIIDDAGCIACVLEGQVRVTTEGFREDTIAERGQNILFKRSCKSLLSAFRDAIVFIPAPRSVLDEGFALYRFRDKSVLTIANSRADSLAQLAQWLAIGGAAATRPLEAAGAS
jgi:hypothetical protein